MREEIMAILIHVEKAIVQWKKRKVSYYPIMIGETFERVSIDTSGRLIESKNGNKYIIIANDWWRKFVIIKAVPNTSAYEVAKYIYEDIIAVHGRLLSIFSSIERNIKTL